ncbi:MAG: hypothetical protein WBE74_23060 [Terracidiphilus sp.]
MDFNAAQTNSEPMAASARPRVVEQYSGYTQPFDVKSAVERMVASVPPKFLVGLSEVVLTNTAGLPRRRRRSVTKSRGKKLKIIQAAGLYHASINNRPAWIDIFVDRTLVGWRKGGFWWLLPRELELQEIVFHEIGHHIHEAIRPEFRECEDVADVWKLHLSRSYFRKQHRLLWEIFRVFRVVFGPLYQRFYRQLMRGQLDKKYISRAEDDELMKELH